MNIIRRFSPLNVQNKELCAQSVFQKQNWRQDGDIQKLVRQEHREETDGGTF